MNKKKEAGKSTFFGGKNGFDFVCISSEKGGTKIECSGSRRKMIEYSRKFNWAVAKLIPVRFKQPEIEL